MSSRVSEQLSTRHVASGIDGSDRGAATIVNHHSMDAELYADLA